MNFPWAGIYIQFVGIKRNEIIFSYSLLDFVEMLLASTTVSSLINGTDRLPVEDWRGR